MLSKEQVRILAWVATGATDDEIALKFRKSPIEIKTEIEAIFKIIGLRDRLRQYFGSPKTLPQRRTISRLSALHSHEVLESSKGTC
jgi:DNA-binding CsgD family transcriptional regulator